MKTIPLKTIKQEISTSNPLGIEMKFRTNDLAHNPILIKLNFPKCTRLERYKMISFIVRLMGSRKLYLKEVLFQNAGIWYGKWDRKD